VKSFDSGGYNDKLDSVILLRGFSYRAPTPKKANFIKYNGIFTSHNQLYVDHNRPPQP